MSASWVRSAVGLVAFFVVLVIGINVTGTLDLTPDPNTGLIAAGNTLIALFVVALVVAIAVYAAIEYAQTRKLESVTRQFDTRTIGFEATERVACIGSSPPASASESSGVLPARRASATMWSGTILAFSVTSRPSAIGRVIEGSASWAAVQALKTIFAASGSTLMFHSVVGAVLPGDR